MRILISESQLNRLYDLDEIERIKLGYGTTHKVYNTRFSEDFLIKMGLKNGDLVTKTGTVRSLKPHYTIFKTYSKSNIFPKVYKFGAKDLNDGNSNAYMIIEFCDNKLFEQRFYKTHTILDNEFGGLDHLQMGDYFFHRGDGYDKYDEGEYRRYLENNPELLKFHDDLMDLVDELHDMNNYNLLGYSDGLDLHTGNFGYNKDGVLKCLDF